MNVSPSVESSSSSPSTSSESSVVAVVIVVPAVVGTVVLVIVPKPVVSDPPGSSSPAAPLPSPTPTEGPHPIDNTDTGACAISYECGDEDPFGGSDDDPGEGGGEATCPHEGAPVIEPASLPACTTLVMARKVYPTETIRLSVMW